MTHHSRDQREQAKLKREMHEALDDDDAGHIEELLAAGQQREMEQPVYQEGEKHE